MPKSLAKVQKKISKKKGNITSLHENSRDSQRLRRAGARSDKLNRVATARAKANRPHMQRVAFFQGAVKEAEGPLVTKNIQSLVERYLKRDDEELAALKDERRQGRPTSTRQDLLQQRILVEEREYDTGFWIPDMANEANLTLLRAWNGQWTSLSTMKYMRLTRKGVKHESSFPPKGQS